MVYLAKGYGAEWLGGLTNSSAANFPMAYIAATCFSLLLAALIGLSAALLGFEVLFLLSSSSSKSDGAKFWSKETVGLLFALGPRQRPSARRHAKALRKGVGTRGAILCTFLACLFGFHAIDALVSQRLGSVLLSAIAFEFDGAPAGRCVLTDDERRMADRKQPVLKAVFLSTAQDKALLIQRPSKLFEPAMLSHMGEGDGSDRRLVFGRVAKCYEPEEPRP